LTVVIGCLIWLMCRWCFVRSASCWFHCGCYNRHFLAQGSFWQFSFWCSWFFDRILKWRSTRLLSSGLVSPSVWQDSLLDFSSTSSLTTLTMSHIIAQLNHAIAVSDFVLINTYCNTDYCCYCLCIDGGTPIPADDEAAIRCSVCATYSRILACCWRYGLTVGDIWAWTNGDDW